MTGPELLSIWFEAGVVVGVVVERLFFAPRRRPPSPSKSEIMWAELTAQSGEGEWTPQSILGVACDNLRFAFERVPGRTDMKSVRVETQVFTDPPFTEWKLPASGMSASGQDAEERLEAKPASPTAEGGDAQPQPPSRTNP